MAKKKKKSNGKPIAIAIAAFAAVGILMPSDSGPEATEPASSVVETVATPNAVQKPSNQPSKQTQNKAPEQVEKSESVPQLDPEKAFKEKLMQYNYVGSSESDKYHKPTCRWTDKINESNLVHFDTEGEASSAGYDACGTCKP